jgi:Putative Flp pilus-assembly TadE/G-like
VSVLMPLRSERERGQVVVFFALLLPVLFALGAGVLSVGNWYVHKRHLQTQVDAAALASGPAFVGCFHDASAANLAIASRALAFAGDTLRPGKYSPTSPDATTNLQVQEPGDVRIALNSASYWAPANGMVPGTDGYGLDHTMLPAPGDPCSTRSLDVKATDEDAPLLFGLLPATPSPKSRAKIEIHDVESLRGMLPWAVPEIDPRRVVALFVDEEPGATPVVFDHQLLEKCAPTLPPPAVFPWAGWCTSAGQEQVVLDSNHDNTGVIILVSKNEDVPALQVSGPLPTICGQSPGLVACYGGATQTSGLSFIHGYNGGYNGALGNPQARQVELTGACTAADLSGPYFMLDGGCSVAVQAVLDFGVTGDPTQHPECARVPGFTWSDGGPDPSRGVWTGTMNLPAASGRNVLNLSGTSGPRNATECGNPGQQPNSWSVSKVAAPYVANGASGPVQYLDLNATYEDGVTVGDPNSVEKNGSPGNGYYNYSVTVGLPKPFSVANFTTAPLLLRMASPSGSQNQAWDCDKNRNFEDEIATGCKTRYVENFRDHDNNPATPKLWNNILCTGWGTGNLPPPTFDGPSPYPSDCVLTETGDKTGPLRGGLKIRFESPCVPNNWPDDQAEADVFFGPDGGGYGNDPRYVTLIITDNTAFTGSGNEALPIKYFAGFYVTGWDLANGGGPQSTNGCPDPDGAGPLKGNDDHPVYGSGYNQSLDNGDVWGYFVDIVLFSGGGDPSDELCEFGGDPAACIAVLVE